MASRFVAVENVDSFINGQKNKNTADKTTQDVNLFKRFLRSKGEEREVYDIEPKNLDAYLGEFFKTAAKHVGHSVKIDKREQPTRSAKRPGEFDFGNNNNNNTSRIITKQNNRHRDVAKCSSLVACWGVDHWGRYHN